jgi:hypothetical protein
MNCDDTSCSQLLQGSKLLWSAGDITLRFAIMATIIRYSVPKLDDDAVALADLLPSLDKALPPPISASSSILKSLPTLSNIGLSAVEGPPKQPASRSLFQRHLKIKKVQSVAPPAAVVPTLSALAHAHSSFEDGKSASEGAASAAAAAAHAAAAHAAADHAAADHADGVPTAAAVSSASDHETPTLISPHAAAEAVASSHAHAPDVTHPAASQWFAVERNAEPSLERVSSSVHRSTVAADIQQPETDSSSFVESVLSNDATRASIAPPSASDGMSEAAAAVVRISEGVGLVELRWKRAAERGRDVESDLKALLLAEDQVTRPVNCCAIFVMILSALFSCDVHGLTSTS